MRRMFSEKQLNERITDQTIYNLANDYSTVNALKDTINYLTNNNLFIPSTWNGTLQLPEGLTVATSFCKIVRNFNELQFIANFRVVNGTESSITINSDSLFCSYEKMPNSVNNKIYAHNGNACADNTSEGTIACAPFMINLTNGPISTDNMPRYASLYHYDGQFRLYTEGGNIEIPSNYTLDFEVRISLAI